jgi:outer membrane protein TolC
MLRKVLFVLIVSGASATAQTSLKVVLQVALENHGKIKAKQWEVQSVQKGIELAKRQALPNLNLGAQQDFGTVNGQFGALYPFGGLSASSAGPTLEEQNWNAAFGALYLANVNWDIFTFGKNKERIHIAEQETEVESATLRQTIFEHKVKVASTYLQWIAAERLTLAYERNLSRADSLVTLIEGKVSGGLIPGADLSMAKADRANASILHLRALEQSQSLKIELEELLGMDAVSIHPDPLILRKKPLSGMGAALHPELEWRKAMVQLNEAKRRYQRSMLYPSVSVVGVIQSRASGFKPQYINDLTQYSTGYFNGIWPNRTNYLFGVGLNWNFTQSYRNKVQIQALEIYGKALEMDEKTIARKLDYQREMAEVKWNNALRILEEVPIQYEAAREAFGRKSALYHNGLADLYDVLLAQNALNRAEAENEVAQVNVWAALLLKAAASGDFSIFENNLE